MLSVPIPPNEAERQQALDRLELLDTPADPYLDTLTLAQQITLAEEQVKTAQEALQLSKQRYKLGLGTVVEVTQSEVAVTAAQTRLAETQFDYKIAEVTLAYTSQGDDTGRILLLSRSTTTPSDAVGPRAAAN